MGQTQQHSFLRRATMMTAGLTGLVGAIAHWFVGWPMSLGIALGALIGVANLAVLARALSGVVDRAEEHAPRPGQRYVLPGVLLLKWPVLLLALAGILWYMPARPEGVAIGVLLSLIGGAIASRSRPETASGD
jgi:hypothetical protein